MNRFFLLCTIVLAFTGCIKPVALIEADLDPKINLQKKQGIKIYIALKDQTVEEKKFSFYLEDELKKQGYQITASAELSDFHLMYALNLENYKTKEYILLSNPEFVSGNIDGKFFTAQRQAYRYEPVERSHAWKELHIDLYQRNLGKLEKVWSGRLKIENDDYRKYTQSCIRALTDTVGQDANKKVTIQ